MRVNVRFLIPIGVLVLAGVPSLALQGRPPAPANGGRSVAITIDDLPAAGDLARMRETTDQLLRTLVAEKVPAIGFVNEINLFVGNELRARTGLLEAWLEAGFELGNHTYSHLSIAQNSFETYKADLIKGEAVTRSLLETRGRRLRYFRHPSLRTGPTVAYKAALDELLAERRYRVAPVTLDNQDFMFADVYANARARGDRETMTRVADAYVPYMESVVEHFERISKEFLGYEVRQTLLLHANELNAERMGDLLRMFRDRGYRFIGLDAALEDPAYALPEVQSTRGLSWIHRWMLARGLPMQPEPAEPAFVRDLYSTLRR